MKTIELNEEETPQINEIKENKLSQINEKIKLIKERELQLNKEI